MTQEIISLVFVCGAFIIGYLIGLTKPPKAIEGIILVIKIVNWFIRKIPTIN